MDEREDWHLTDALHYDHGRGDPFAAAVRATRMAMVITDPAKPDNPIVFVNEAFQKLSGYSREEIVGRNCRFLQGPDSDPQAVARVREAIEQGRSIDIDLLNYRKDGSTFWNALYLSPVRDEADRIRFYFASQLDVSDRVEAQASIHEQKRAVEEQVAHRTAELQEALAAKTLLLHEVDHRVRNNLTMIGSLLRLQARGIEDAAAAARLEVMLERVDALATVHRQLYQSGNVQRFDVAEFARSLVADVVGSSGRTDIAIEVDVEPLEVRSEHATSLGLVLNEIVTNAIKHAFDERAGRLTLRSRREAGSGTIEICDDGPGCATAPAGGGMGMSLIDRLSRQADARATWHDNGPGACVSVSFPIAAGV